MEIKAISPIEFEQKVIRNSEMKGIDHLNYYKTEIEQAENFAIAPYFWIIPDQLKMVFVAASENIGRLTPYSQAEWINKDAFFWFNNMHPADRDFVMAATSMSIEIHELFPPNKDLKIRVNMYCRMLDAKSNFRWILMQFPKNMYDENNKVISGFVMMTDLSHLPNQFQTMMTVIDHTDNRQYYYATSLKNKKLIQINIPKITKREQEILQLMAAGLNSPQIAEKLFLSYHTVEKHKRNIREKTNTKTSAELIDFVWRNNLI